MRIKKNVEYLLQRNIKEINRILNIINNSNIEGQIRGLFYFLDTFLCKRIDEDFFLKKEIKIQETCRVYFYKNFPKYKDYNNIIKCYNKEKKIVDSLFEVTNGDNLLDDEVDDLIIKAAEYVFCDSSNFGKDLTETQVIQIIQNRLTAERRNNYIDEILS